MTRFDVAPQMLWPNDIGSLLSWNHDLEVIAEYPINHPYSQEYGRCFVYAYGKADKHGHRTCLAASLFTWEKLLDLIALEPGAEIRLYYQSNPVDPDEIYPSMEIKRHAR